MTGSGITSRDKVGKVRHRVLCGVADPAIEKSDVFAEVATPLWIQRQDNRMRPLYHSL
jgi:hypothetical protein